MHYGDEQECNPQLTISKRSRTNFSDSPRYLEVSVAEETLKKVVPHSVATALASIVLPVPGGPTISTPFHGRRIPWEDTQLLKVPRAWSISAVRASDQAHTAGISRGGRVSTIPDMRCVLSTERK